MSLDRTDIEQIQGNNVSTGWFATRWIMIGWFAVGVLTGAYSQNWIPSCFPGLSKPAAQHFGNHSDSSVKQNKSANPKLNASPPIETVFRRTKYGWEDSTQWEFRQQPIPQQLDAVHPVVWAGIVMSLAMLVLFAGSKPSDVEQWFSDLDQILGGDEKSKNAPPQGR
jgi:hypothetical protein